MKIEGQLEKEDHVKAYRLSRRMTSFDKMIWFLCSLMVLRFLTESWFGKSGEMFNYGTLGLALAILSFVTERLWIPAKLRKRDEPGTPKEIEINDDGITTGTPEGKESVSWLRLHKYKVGKDMTLLYRHGGDHLIFPDRWFIPLEKVEFDRYLRKEIGEPTR